MAEKKCKKTNLDHGLDGYIRNLIEEIVEKEVERRLLCIMKNIAKETEMENKTLTAKELRVRWGGISENTLRNREKEGIIQPLDNGGRKKIYSMKDVIRAESSGYVKAAC